MASKYSVDVTDDKQKIQAPLSHMVTDRSRLSREAAKRRKDYKEVSVGKHEIQHYRDLGWEFVKELKTKAKFRSPIGHDERLENKTWMLAYLLGYPEISSGRNFQVEIKRKGAEPYLKQIDVLAKDDETVIVAECKSSKKVSRRSLQKDIEEFSNLKGPIASSIKAHYGNSFKPKIIWFFFTNNIVWSKPDRERAAGANIQIVTEKELRYFLQIADHLRAAARFQFLAEFLRDQRIPEMQNVRVPAIKGKLGGKPFYSFVSTPRQMLKISFVNHRSLSDPNGAPSYQRLVSRTRLRQISKFISDGGFFPTNILVNFASKCRFEPVAKNEEANVQFGNLYLPDRYRGAWIIDGQHRLYGFAPLDEKKLSQNIMVVAFEGLRKEEEANLFVEINHEQKSVPKTLLDDLEGELKWGSTKPSERIGAISARLVGLLNGDIGEPFYGRVTQQGIAPTEKTCLTVPAIKDGLKRSGLVGTSILRNAELHPGPLTGANDTETLERARAVVNSFFQLIQSAAPTLWESGRSGLLCTNVAVQAYLQLLSSLVSYVESNTGLNPRELEPNEIISEVEEYVDPVLKWLQSASLTNMESTFKVQFGSGGPREYYFRLCKIVKGQFSDFTPEGVEEWEKEQSIERISEADRKIKDLNVYIQKFIFDVFKNMYGSKGDAYFSKGVVDKKIMTDAYAKSLDDDDADRMPLEHYLDFLHYRKIVESKQNWPIFKAVFNIPEPGEKGLSKNIKWMDRINELRRISAHATERRTYKLDDYEYIDWVYEEFMSRLESFDIDTIDPKDDSED